MKKLLTLPNGKGGGWKPDLPNANDWPLSKRLGALPRGTPEHPSLKPEFFPRIRDQGELGSCVGHGLRSCISYKMRERYPEKVGTDWGKNQWDLSPLAMYWLARKEEGDQFVTQDSGAYIRLGVDAARKHGIPTEEAWPYRIPKFTRKPSERALKTGKWHQASPSSYRCDEDGNAEKTIDRMLQALAAGMPVVYGFSVYANFSRADDSGVVPLPGGRNEGGHCIATFWADTQARIFWGPNSYGGQWGGNVLIHPQGHKAYEERGYIGIPFEFFTRREADDAWAIDLEDAP